MKHVIWDWNGTLLDDIDIVVDSVNATVGPLGVSTQALEDYQRLYTRPVPLYYERMLGRAISDTEWRQLDDTFHAEYASRLRLARLSAGAEDIMSRLSSDGTSQSLLSMAPHDHLVEAIAAHQIDRYFVRVDGLRDGSGALKAASLDAHLRALLAHPSAPDEPTDYLVIGDSTDDATAARANGVPAVMFDSGSHRLADLEATGYPVAATLEQAIRLGQTRAR